MRALVFGIVVAMAFSTASLAGPKTTAPGRDVNVYVNVTDKGITTAMYGFANSGGIATLFVETTVTRGQRATFLVHNLGKRPHNFVVFGKKTPTLKAGGKARFSVSLLRRGAFPFESTLDRNKKGFRGVFTVY